MLIFLPRIDPLLNHLERSKDTYSLIRTSIILFFADFHSVILLSVITNQNQLITDLIIGGIGLLFMVMGNYMPRMCSNWFMGIRTPWTLSSETVWRKTDRLGGRLFMLAGLLMIFTIDFFGANLQHLADDKQFHWHL